MTITDFLLARIAEDEAIARAVAAERVRIGEVTDYPAEGEDHSFWTDFDGASPSVSVGADRVLAECAAKRSCIDEAWVDLLRIESEWGSGRGQEELESLNDVPAVVSALAAVYADHPDYDEAWRP